MFKKVILFVFVLTILIISVIAEENKTVILATTTSVQDTGLLDVLMESFENETGYTVKPIAVGTGQALKLGMNGEVDIVWVHSPDDEKKFIEEGYGINRTTFMHNDFVVLGPASDPAGLKNAKSVVEGFKNIFQKNALFISRGDQSGTHKKELKIWKLAEVMPNKEKYNETGQGMAATLRVADEKQSYCLADRSSYLSLKKNISLVILFEGDKELLNYYSIILVNPQKFPKVNVKGAEDFFDFLLSGKTKEVVENFGKKKFGQQLFFYDYKEKDK
ncbi:MAG: substrate-binding domain-containing protein [Candidatus Firestonebacteria bacterium]